jgi:hypothetical protein
MEVYEATAVWLSLQLLLIEKMAFGSVSHSLEQNIIKLCHKEGV